VDRSLSFLYLQHNAHKFHFATLQRAPFLNKCSLQDPTRKAIACGDQEASDIQDLGAGEPQGADGWIVWRRTLKAIAGGRAEGDGGQRKGISPEHGLDLRPSGIEPGGVQPPCPAGDPPRLCATRECVISLVV